MPVPLTLGEMTLTEMRARVRNLCNVPTTATGQWGDDRLNQELNLAAVWLQGRLIDFHLYWSAVRTGPVAISDGRFPFPADFLVERQFVKRLSSIPEKWEEIDISDAPNNDGVIQMPTARERWTVRDGEFRYVGPGFTAATYDLEYLQRIPRLYQDDERFKIPGQWHYVVCLRAAFICSAEVEELARHETLKTMLAATEKEIDEEAARLTSIRQRERGPKDVKFGTAGYVREVVLNTLAAAGKKSPDYWTDRRLYLHINNARWEMQVDLMALNPEWFSRRLAVTCTANVIQCPIDTVRLRLLYTMSGGVPVPEVIVGVSEIYQQPQARPAYEPSTGLLTGRPVWHIEGGAGNYALRAQTGYSVDGAYWILYEPLLERITHDEQEVGIPLEHTNTLIAKACAFAMRSIGDLDGFTAQTGSYAGAIAGVRGRVLQEKAQLKRHQIRDSSGYNDDDVGGWY